MDLIKKHLVELLDKSFSILEVGEALPKDCILLGPISINADGSFEEGLNSILINEKTTVFYHSLKAAREERLALIRRGRNDDLRTNDNLFLIALKNENLLDQAALRLSAHHLRDLPIVAKANLDLLTSLSEIKVYNP